MFPLLLNDVLKPFTELTDYIHFILYFPPDTCSASTHNFVTFNKEMQTEVHICMHITFLTVQIFFFLMRDLFKPCTGHAAVAGFHYLPTTLSLSTGGTITNCWRHLLSATAGPAAEPQHNWSHIEL